MNFKEFKNKFEHVPVVEYPNSINKTPLVNICIQTYQHKNYIINCLDGILKQKTNFPFEILLGEDASTDGTREICIEYAKQNPNKIKLFLHHRENNISILGAPTGRFNFMYNVYSSKGKYIAFCEGDDYWNDDLKLQKQIDFLEENPTYSLSYHNATIINNKNELIKNNKLEAKWRSDYSEIELQKAPFILTLSMCFRNQFDDFPPEFIKVINGDTFLISLLGGIGKGKFQENVFPAAYRMHEGGLWSSLKKDGSRFHQKMNTFLVLSEYYARINNLDLKENFHKKYVNAVLGLIGVYTKTKKYKKIKYTSQLFLKESNDSLKFFFLIKKILLNVFKSV